MDRENTMPTVAMTGAGSILGRAIAEDFAKAGWRVFAATREADAVGRLAAESADGVCEFAHVDVADGGAVADWIAGVEAQAGGIDGLVCAEAIYPRVHFLDQSAHDWDEVMRVNVGGVANACRAVLPGMLRRRHGAIVVVGSMANLRPIAGASAYSASRGALHALVMSLAAEIDPAVFPDVRINEYLPVANASGPDGTGFEPGWQAPHVRRLIADPAFRGTAGFWSTRGPVRLDPSLRAVGRELWSRVFRRSPR